MKRALSPEDIVRRWAALWSSESLGGAEDVFTTDLRDHRAPPLHSITGVDGEKQFIASVRSAFPDLSVEVEEMVAQGDHVAARVVHRGTHRGHFLGIAPTGRSVTYEGTVIFRIVGGKIAERWGTVDLFGILWQLGAAPISPAVMPSSTMIVSR